MRWYNPLENLASMPTRSLGVPLFEGGRKPLTRNQGIPIGQIVVISYRDPMSFDACRQKKKVASACPLMPLSSFLTASVSDLMVEPTRHLRSLTGRLLLRFTCKCLQTDRSEFSEYSSECQARGHLTRLFEQILFICPNSAFRPSPRRIRRQQVRSTYSLVDQIENASKTLCSL